MVGPTAAAHRTHSLGRDKTLVAKTAAAAAEMMIAAAAAAAEGEVVVAMEVEVEVVANYQVLPNPLK